MFNRGDIVRLREEQQGRRCEGKVHRLTKDGQLTVLLPNGLEATQPIGLWELCRKGSSNAVSVFADADVGDDETIGDETNEE